MKLRASVDEMHAQPNTVHVEKLGEYAHMHVFVQTAATRMQNAKS